ncbi:MAG: hypothetical protein ACOC06_06235 [Halorubrum sp.]
MSIDLRSIDDVYCALADRLEGLPVVVGVDVVEHDAQLARPALEISVGPDLERVPPEIVRIVGEADVGIRDVSPRPGGYFVVLAV